MHNRIVSLIAIFGSLIVVIAYVIVIFFASVTIKNPLGYALFFTLTVMLLLLFIQLLLGVADAWDNFRGNCVYSWSSARVYSRIRTR